MPYHQVKLTISKAQQKKALNGGSIRIPTKDIGVGQVVMLHPLNVKKVANAKGGINLQLSPGEIIASADYHNLIGKINPSLSGNGFFDSVYQGLKKVGSFLKDSGIATTLADSLATAATPFVGPAISGIGRELVRNIGGVGIKKRGRPAKKTGGAGLYL